MDSTTSQTLAYGGVIGSALSILLFLYNTFNHRVVRSKCCGRKLEVSLDIDSTIAKPVSPKTSSETSA